MPYAITLRLDTVGAREVQKLWRALDAGGAAKSIGALGYDPHITLSRHDDLDPLAVADTLDQFAAGIAPIRIEMTLLGTFTDPSPVVWIGPSPSPALSSLQANLRMLLADAPWHPHTEPPVWVPHCTLATAIPDAAAFEAVQDQATAAFAAFSCLLDRLELVRFPPVAILESIPLEGQFFAGPRQ